MSEAAHVMSGGLMQSPSSQADGSDGNKEKCSGGDGGGNRKEFNFWTDQEVWLLLDAYEDKWNQLDRGNVKSKHWEEIAARLSTTYQTTGLLAAKTPTQCKNKIEDMKKKYRSEKGAKLGSSSYSKWLFFQRMESLLRNGFNKGCVGMPGGMDSGELTQQQIQHPVMDLDYGIENHQLRQQCGLGRLCDHKEVIDEEDGSFTTQEHHHHHEHHQQQQHQQQARKEKGGGGYLEMPSGKKQRRGFGGGGGGAGQAAVASEMVWVMKCFGESLVRIEEAQIEMQREVARLSAEAEFRRIDMEVKRTEMMLNTQLQIAKMFSSKGRKKKVGGMRKMVVAGGELNGGDSEQGGGEEEH